MHANMRAPITIRPLTIPAYLPRRVGTSHETMTLYSTDIKVRELTPPENSVTIATVVLSPFKITRRCGRRGVVHNKSSWDWFLRCVLISQSQSDLTMSFTGAAPLSTRVRVFPSPALRLSLRSLLWFLEHFQMESPYNKF